MSRSTAAPFSACQAYVASQGRTRTGSTQPARLPGVTISRQTGARGVTIGQQLAESLSERSPGATVPWTLFDKELVRRVLEDNDLPAEIEKYMPEAKVGAMDSLIGEILGTHPSLWTLFEKTTETIWRLASQGHVILVGRGGNIIARRLPNIVHVRLVGSEEARVSWLRESRGMASAEARRFLRHEDSVRRGFLEKQFHADIDDPLLYDLVVNTDGLSNATVVEIIASAVLSKAPAPAEA